MQSRKFSCVVLGGGGFLGINLCRRLVSSGHRVRAFGHPGLFPAALSGVEFQQGDFCEGAAFAEMMKGAEIVFHLVHSTVPSSSNLDASRELRDNVLPTIALLELAHAAGVRRIIFLSSGGTIYGRPPQIPTEESAPLEPITAYGISKLAIEKYLALYRLLHGLDYRIMRVANPFGPFQVSVKRQGLIAETVFRALRGEPIEVWGDGSVVRDFIFVDDVIDALEAVIADTGSQHIYNVGSGLGRSVREVLAIIEQMLGVRLEISRQNERMVDVPASILSVKRAAEHLEWRPKTFFENGIAQTIAWWKDNDKLITQSLAHSKIRAATHAH